MLQVCYGNGVRGNLKPVFVTFGKAGINVVSSEGDDSKILFRLRTKSASADDIIEFGLQCITQTTPLELAANDEFRKLQRLVAEVDRQAKEAVEVATSGELHNDLQT